jgi:hypothetical protein
MLIALPTVRAVIKRIKRTPDHAAELQEVEDLRVEGCKALADDTSWVSGSELERLFFADIEEAKRLISTDKAGNARAYLSSAKATLHCIRLNIKHADKPPVSV